MKARLIWCLAALAAAAAVYSAAAAPSPQEYKFANIQSLEIQGEFFAVEVRVGQGDELLCRAEIPEILQDKVQVLFDEKAGRLRAGLEHPELVAFNAGARARLLFTVPAATELSVETSSGSIYVEGIKARELIAGTASGNIVLKGIKARIVAASSSGQLLLEACDGQKELRSASGQISLRNASGAIEAATASGSQYYRDTRGDLKAKTASGGIKVENMEGGLDLESASGSLSGSGVLVTRDSFFKTVSGSINFAFRNYLSDFRFALSTTSGSLRAGANNGRGSLQCGEGRLRIRGESVSGSQTYQGM